MAYDLMGVGGRGTQSLFSALTFYGYIYCLIAGMKLTSDCLMEAHPLWRRGGLWYARLFSNKKGMSLPPVIAP
jgi:hypothetical protein